MSIIMEINKNKDTQEINNNKDTQEINKNNESIYTLQESIEIIKKLEYPLEWIQDLNKCFNIVKTGDGIQYSEKIDWTCITKLNVPKLGLFILDRDIMNLSHYISSSYNLKYRAQSKRYNDISPYDYWCNNKDKVIQLAVNQLIRYQNTYAKYNLPIDLPENNEIEEHNEIDIYNTKYDAYKSLENECSLCLFRLGMPSSFPANLMTYMLKNNVNNYVDNNLRILDISAGWGDRLISAISLDANYLSCDPNSNLSNTYYNMIHTYGNPEKQKVFTMPFEDLDIKTLIANGEILPKYNVLYTSPPFFDLEIYSNEETQSINRYKSLDIWLDKFLFKSLKICNDLLEKDSKIYLHFSDIIGSDKKLFFVERTINFCKSIGWTFKGMYGHTIKDNVDKKSETTEIRNEKNKKLLKPTQFVKLFKDGIRINKYGQALSSPIWHFTK